MYIGFIHHYVPKLFGGLACLVNPLFIYLIFTNKSRILGNYRFLLLYFAMFNIIYSLLEMAVPIGISGYRYCFYLFLTDGYFQPSSKLNHLVLTIRCSMLGISYAILISHFVFRYLVIKRSQYTSKFFHRYMIGSFILCFLYFVFFVWICEVWLPASSETKNYVNEGFNNEYAENSTNYNMLSAIYNEADFDEVFSSWVGVLLLVLMSAGSIYVFFLFGYQIIKHLNDALANTRMSESTALMQRKLLKALAVQTAIPILVSFLPSMVAWFSPVFNYNMGRVFNYTGVVALSAFPFFDPVAIILFLPVLRDQIFGKHAKCNNLATVSSTVNTVNNPSNTVNNLSNSLAPI